MKVIDLLNKIANGEIKQGTKIKYMGMEFLYDFPNLCGIYKVGGNTAFKNSLFYFIDASRLDNNIEIIEDNTIDNIEELEEFKYNEFVLMNREERFNKTINEYSIINKLVQAVKQLNKEIKELKK